MAKRENFVSLTDQDVQKLKGMIRTGEPVYRIAKRMASTYNRSVSSFYITLLNIAKRTYKVAEWNGPKRTRSTSKKVSARMSENVQNSITGNPVRVEKYADHIRVYF